MGSSCQVETTPLYPQSPTTFSLPMHKPRPLVSDLHYPLKLGCWNTRGWPLDSQFRSRVILSLDLDLIGICETFLQGNNEIHLEGYTWLGNNRKQISKRAIRGSGGVGLLVKDTVFHRFTLSVLDNKSEGILWVPLLDQVSQASIALCVCYLPPSNSSRGDISLEVFNNLRLQVSKYQDSGLLCICGDFNARIGSLVDTDIETVSDSVPNREILDTAPPNTHGKELIEFLRDVGMVILNGRGSSTNDSFTFIGTNGSSVVDYCLIPIEQWHLFGPFSVISPLDVSHRFHIPVDCSLPDHSILLWSVKFDSSPTFNKSQNSYSPNLKCKFKIPPNYMQSHLALSRIQYIIDNINPLSVQECYKDTCDLIFSELIPSNPSKPKKCCHPWWNPRLNSLKQSLRLKQRAWLQQKDNPQLKLAYQFLQKTFDKEIKKAKADHRRHKQIQLLQQCKHDTKNFWRNFKQIGIHCERKTIPNQVINAEGEVLSEPSALLQVWKGYFNSLYNRSSLSAPSKIYSLPSITHMPANSSARN